MQMRVSSWSLALASLLGLAACTAPTSAPTYDALWAIPTSATTIGVAELLPAGVSATPTALLVTTIAANTSAPVSVPGVGVVALPTALDVSASLTIPTPDAFLSGVVASGQTLVLSLRNTTGIDILRPDATHRGTITVTMRSNGTTIGSQVISGTTTTFAAGTTRQVPLAITPGAITDPITLSVDITLPAGTTIARPLSGAIVATAAVQQLAVTEATAQLTSEAVAAAPIAISVSNIDAKIRERAKTATLRVRFDNPWSATVTGTITLSPASGAAVVTAPITVPAGGSTTDVAISASALRALLNASDIRVRFTGTATGTGANQSTRVQPGQSLQITSDLTMNFEVGS